MSQSISRAVRLTSHRLINPKPITFNVTNQIQIRERSNRSRRGLYDGKDVGTGNNVSFSMRKTKRRFNPNSFKKRVYSEILDEMIQFHITAAALRSIDKAGGLDSYLLKSKHVIEGEGAKAKKRILQKIDVMRGRGLEVLGPVTYNS